ncbi:MAG TPA: non-oxidative hydroxyarylic acid decarboxylases subunit C [Ktedonobacteraceae bacterium]
MVYRDLRSFLQRLDEERQLLHINQQVMPEPDLGAAGRAVTRLGEMAPALLFDNVYGYDHAQVALNVMGSWANHALMLDLPVTTPVKEQFFEVARRWQTFPIPAERVETAPFYEHEITDQIDLFQLCPLFRLNEHDGGCYIDKACIITKDLDDPDHFGKQNVGIYRVQVKGKAKLGLQPVPMHDAGIHLRIAEERGENLPIAIAVGCDPVIEMMACSPLRYDQSEYEMAGAIQGEPYRIVRGKRTGLAIPWGAEIVIEGEVLAGQREIEGPFGEFTGSYSGGRLQPVIKVNAVYHRSQPIFEHLYLGIPWTEIDYMTGISTSIPIYQQLKTAFPEVVAVNAMYTHGLATIISTKSRFGGFAKAVGMHALSTPHGMGYCKVVIMVDNFVDPFNLQQVMWALSTRFAADKDLVVIPQASVVPLDPGSHPPGITHKIIIDATTPTAPDIRGEFAQPVQSPPEADKWEHILSNLWKKEGHK